MVEGTAGSESTGKKRPVIALFDYPDVFEDFYPHYGVDQCAFAESWAGTGNHAFAAVLERQVGAVVWYEFSLAPQIDERRHAVTGCRVRMLKSSLLHRLLWRAFYLPKQSWRWRRAYRLYEFAASYAAIWSASLLRALRQDRPDYVFVQDYASGKYDSLAALCCLLRIPLIAYHSGSIPDRYVGRAAKRWTFRLADLLIASSCSEREMLIREYSVPPQRIEVILTPIDTDLYRPVPRAMACERAGLDPRFRYVLFMGRLEDQVKRISDLMQAFATVVTEHPDARMLVVGEGPDSARLRSLARKLAPDRIFFLGWVNDAERKAELYSLAECTALVSRHEGFPTVVGESMACATPVLATAVGGVAELVRDGETGWLLSPDELGPLAQCLNDVFSSRRLGELRAGARELAEQRVSRTSVGAALQRCFAALKPERTEV